MWQCCLAFQAKRQTCDVCSFYIAQGCSFHIFASACDFLIFDDSFLFCPKLECDLTYCFFNRGKFLEMCDDLLARVEPPLRSVLEQSSKYFCHWIVCVSQTLGMYYVLTFSSLKYLLHEHCQFCAPISFICSFWMFLLPKAFEEYIFFNPIFVSNTNVYMNLS